MAGVHVEGGKGRVLNLGSELLGSLVITIAERANLAVFVIDGGRTLKPVFLPGLQFSSFHSRFLCLIG